MLMKLALAFLIAVTGAGVPRAESAPSSTASAVPAAAIVAADAPAEDVTVTELEVVVPAVDPAGDVVESAEVLDALAEPAVVVTDDLLGVGRVQSEVVEPGDFQTLGVTWPTDASVEDLAVEVRTRSDGDWTEWVPLEPADAAPDSGSADAAHSVRGGTDSLWVGDADAVQLSFAATSDGGPDGLSLALVDVPETDVADAAGASFGLPARSGAFRASTADYRPTGLDPVVERALSAALLGEGSATADGTSVTGDASVAVPAMAPIHRIITRAEWGARPQVCTPDVAPHGLVGAAVHHTAGSNSYSTVAEAMRQIRGDQAYHIDGRGWCDIGYNFIVDKWGNIYEGRADSLFYPVVGVHAGGFNTGTVGIAMLGTYSGYPPAQVQQSVGQIIGMRLSAYNVDPRGVMIYHTGTGENSKFQNQDVSLNRVFGHRDVAYTACPGNGGYAVLSTIRAVAGAYFDAQFYAESEAVVKALYADLLGRGPDPTGLAGWTAALFSGTSQAMLVDTLTRSDEYIALRVARAYADVLGRGPDPVGAQGWLEAIRNRQATVDDVQRRFYDSQEFFLASGGTAQGYVQRLYTTVLRRGASEAEVAGWVGAMSVRGRAWVVDSIWFSTEAARVRAGDYYMTFLGRGPDPTGLAAWAQVLLTNGEGAVRNGIAGSVEYRARAVTRYPSESVSV